MDNSFEKLINRVLDGRYKIENVVGIGGMAYVLKAIDLQCDNRPVAIKILNEEFNSDKNAVKRFLNESEAVAMLDSPYIVKIHDVAITESLKYIVMEFIDGITLKDYIDKVGALGWKEAVHYVRQILSGLAHAHEKGIIHRDIKPQNIMLLRDGKVKVTDFGIAKMPTSESLTMTDKAIGTVNYISPEQASGEPVDEKSDLYSVGVMLYEMLTGTLPFKADSPVAVAMMQVSETPVPPRELNAQIPVGLEQIVLRAMNKKPEERFNCASSMEKALGYFAKNPEVVFAEGAASSDNAGKAKKNKNNDDNEEGKHRSMFPIILGVTMSFFVVVVISLVIIFTSQGVNPDGGVAGIFDKILNVDGNNSEERKITVESFVGKRYNEELVQQLSEKGYEVVEIKYVDAKNKAPDEIERQEPVGGTIKIKPEDGKKIPLVLYVNNYTESQKMPDCTRISLKAAIDLLVRKYSPIITYDNVEIVEEFHEEVRKGQVYDSIPSPDEKIDLSTLKVTLFVSKGPELEEVTMPAVVGMSYADARKMLEAENIKNVTREYVDSTEPTNTVIGANYNEGDVFMEDTEIVLQVSRKVVPTVSVPENNPDDTQTESPETVPETAPETAPETEPETEPETTPETVPDSETESGTEPEITPEPEQPEQGGETPSAPESGTEDGGAQEGDGGLDALLGMRG